MHKKLPLILAIAILLSSCTSHPVDVTESDVLPEIYPDYVEVTVPVGIAPLNFSMADDWYDKIDVGMSGERGGSLRANGSYADFDFKKRHELLSQNRGSRINSPQHVVSLIRRSSTVFVTAFAALVSMQKMPDLIPKSIRWFMKVRLHLSP